MIAFKDFVAGVVSSSFFGREWEPLTAALEDANRWMEAEGVEVVNVETVVLPNGCFDLIHAGHVRALADARAEGDRLVVTDLYPVIPGMPLKPLLAEQVAERLRQRAAGETVADGVEEALR